VAALRDARKITTLYTHQANAIAALSQGKDVIVSTSTASGKSVIYQARPSRSLRVFTDFMPDFMPVFTTGSAVADAQTGQKGQGAFHLSDQS
jgi:hypothetical protein